MDVLFDKNEAGFSFLAASQARILGFDQKLGDIIVCQVAEHPLDQNTIVLRIKVVFLQSAVEESTDVGAVVPRFLDLRSRRLKEVYVCELRDESLLRNSPDARTAVKSGSCRWHQMSESNDHGATRVAFNFMDVSVAAQYTVHGRGLTIPVINAAFVPILFVYYCRQQLRFFSRSRVLPLLIALSLSRCLAGDGIELSLPNLL